MTVVYALYSTPLGIMIMAACAHTDVPRLGFLAFGDTKHQATDILKAAFPKTVLEHALTWSPGCRDAFSQWHAALQSYLTMKAADPSSFLAGFSLDLQGTDFQKSVWRYLQTIPVGQTCSYTDVARAIGRPSAVRAAGSACGKNRISLVVPCHRVIRSDGSLGGFRWGLTRKRQLLDIEAHQVSP